MNTLSRQLRRQGILPVVCKNCWSITSHPITTVQARPLLQSPSIRLLSAWPPRQPARSVAYSHAFSKSCRRAAIVRSSPAHAQDVGRRYAHRVAFMQTAPMRNLQRLFRQYPFAMSLWVVIMAGGVVLLGILNYDYIYRINPSFSNYPEQVVKQLRRAVYYTTIDTNAQKALLYFDKAINLCKELGMDAYSDEVVGIKIMVAQLLEKVGNIPEAIKSLEMVRAECIDRADAVLTRDEEGLTDELRQRYRTRLLFLAIRISTKLGELYANPYVNNDAAALEVMLWAVTLVLREHDRREAVGATDDSHGPWLVADQRGAVVEQLAHDFEKGNNHYVAAPLFLQALALKETADCHSVVLMNNLSISLAQQNVPQERGGPPPPSREELVLSAKEWAQKALVVAGEIKPPVRTEECDQGCAVATHNLGEFAEMLGDTTAARKRYKEAKSLAKAIGFKEGVQNADEGLARLNRRFAITE